MAPKVREAIKTVKYYGWRQEKKGTRGSHRQFTHPRRPGRVTIAGHKSKVLDIDEWRSIVKQGGLPKRIIREFSTWKRWR